MNTIFNVPKVVIMDMENRLNREPLAFQFSCSEQQIGDVHRLLKGKQVAVSEVKELAGQVVVSGVCFDNQIGKIRRLLVAQKVISEDEYGRLQIAELSGHLVLSEGSRN